MNNNYHYNLENDNSFLGTGSFFKQIKTLTTSTPILIASRDMPDAPTDLEVLDFQSSNRTIFCSNQAIPTVLTLQIPTPYYNGENKHYIHTISIAKPNGKPLALQFVGVDKNTDTPIVNTTWAYYLSREYVGGGVGQVAEILQNDKLTTLASNKDEIIKIRIDSMATSGVFSGGAFILPYGGVEINVEMNEY